MGAKPWPEAAVYLREGSVMAADLDGWESALRTAGALDEPLAEVIAKARAALPGPSRLSRRPPSARQRWALRVSRRRYHT